MHLYHLTLSRPSGVQTACYGNFSGPKVRDAGDVHTHPSCQAFKASMHEFPLL